MCGLGLVRRTSAWPVDCRSPWQSRGSGSFAGGGGSDDAMLSSAARAGRLLGGSVGAACPVLVALGLCEPWAALVFSVIIPFLSFSVLPLA